MSNKHLRPSICYDPLTGYRLPCLTHSAALLHRTAGSHAFWRLGPAHYAHCLALNAVWLPVIAVHGIARVPACVRACMHMCGRARGACWSYASVSGRRCSRLAAQGVRNKPGGTCQGWDMWHGTCGIEHVDGHVHGHVDGHVDMWMGMWHDM